MAHKATPERSRLTLVEKQLEAYGESVVAGFCDFLVEHYGSVLKAWRSALDPTSEGELFFSEFVQALTRVNWHGDTSALWSGIYRRALANDRDAAVSLRELSKDDHACVEAFRSWTLSRFGGAIDMFETLSGRSPNASLTYEEFQAACRRYGFMGDVQKIFHEALDLDGVGAITVRDMAPLECDAIKRKAVLNPNFLISLEAAKTAAKKLRKRERLQQRTQHEALKDFRMKVRAACGGSFIRGWRLIDTDGNLAVSKIELMKGCKKIAFNGDVVSLWKAMDVDDDGAVHLQEVDVRMALVLARFKKWSGEHYGSCVNCIEQLASMTRKRVPKWNVEEFSAALRAAKFPIRDGMQSHQAAAMLHEALDVNDIGTITKEDVAFLDKWEPTPWLCADPDVKEKDRLIAALRSRYSNLIVAWRRLLDRDNTNRVGYKEFSDACRLLRFQNVAGIWRALDADASGYISLGEIDPDSADALIDFKDWAENKFGTIHRAFRSLDTTRSNSLSFPVFKRALQDFGFKGDARLLFQSLKPEAGARQGGRDARLTLEDLRYMSSWEIDRPLDKEIQGDTSRRSSRRLSERSIEGIKATSRAKQPEAESIDSSKSKDAIKPPPVAWPRSEEREQVLYCRSENEFRVYQKCRPDGMTSRSNFNFSMGDLLLPRVVEKVHTHRASPSLHAYKGALWPTSNLRAQAGGEKFFAEDGERGMHRGKSKPSQQGSVSLPALARNPVPDASTGEKRSAAGASAASAAYAAAELPHLPGLSRSPS